MGGVTLLTWPLLSLADGACQRDGSCQSGACETREGGFLEVLGAGHVSSSPVVVSTGTDRSAARVTLSEGRLCPCYLMSKQN